MMPAGLPGRYAGTTGSERDCTLRCISRDDLEILVDAAQEPLTRVVGRMPGLSVLTGHAGCITERSFRLGLEAGVHQRRWLAARIGWHQARALEGPEGRESARVVPARSDVVVSSGDVGW